MNSKLADFTKNFSFYCLSLSFILVPVFFLPFTTDYFNFQKQTLLIFLTALSFFSWLIHNLATKSVRLTLSPLLLPFFIFAAVITISSVINPSNLNTWLNQPALYLTLLIYYLLLTSLIQESKQVKTLLNYFVFIPVLLAIWGILSTTGTFTQSSLPDYLTLKSFTPAGSPLNLVTFLIAILPLTLTLAFKTSSGPQKLKFFLSSGLITSAIILIGYQLLPNHDFTPALLPKLAGWSIAVDTFKSQVFFGAGPSNFINQFTRFKPLSLNQTNYWNILFTNSSNEYLQLLTTLGILGFIAFALIIYAFTKLIKRQPGTRITASQQALQNSIFTILILGFFVPFTPVLYLTLIAMMALVVGTHKSKNLTKVKDVILTISAINVIDSQALTPQLPSKPLKGILPWLLAIPATLGIILILFQVKKVYAADYFFKKSLEAIQQNQGSEAYNFQIKAIQTLEKVDSYHVSYSNVNLALANSLASQGNLTDQDQQTIAQLVQQAIREARSAAQLNPQKATNWSNLANIYRQLVNFADGASDFAIASYTRAIQLDPSNPTLRLELGGLLYSLQQYDQAITHFQEAIQLKPNYANAYYNLANAYKQQEKYLEAYQTMQQVIDLIPATSSDFDKAQTELEDLKAKLPQNQTQTPKEPTAEEKPETSLTEPSPLPKAPKDFEPIPRPSPSATPQP